MSKATENKAKGYDWEAARAYNRSKRTAKATGIPRGSVNGNS